MPEVQAGTVPDVNRLWQLAQRVRMAQLDALSPARWEMTFSDWHAVQRCAPPGSFDAAARILFDYPVHLVPDEYERWPELVFVCNRRKTDPESTSDSPQETEG